MPRSIPRTLALAAMVLIALPSGFFALLWWAVADGAFENSDPTAADRVVALAFIIGFAVTMAAIAGLAVGSRLLTALAALVQAGVVVLLLVLWQSPDYQIGEDDTYFISGLISVLVVDFTALAAALMPSPRGARQRVRSAVTMAVGSRRKAALIAMGLVAAASLSLLLAAASNIGRNVEHTYTVTGVVGLAGALVALLGLRACSRSVAAGAAVVQAVLAAMLYLLFGFFSVATFSAVPFVLLAIGVADVLTMRAAFLSESDARA